jgi:hypothetical protein
MFSFKSRRLGSSVESSSLLICGVWPRGLIRGVWSVGFWSVGFGPWGLIRGFWSVGFDPWGFDPWVLICDFLVRSRGDQ